MALIQNWFPPTRVNYETLFFLWKFFPAVRVLLLPSPPDPPKLTYPRQAASLQWAVSWYGMGKTSTPSSLNIPGRLAWFTMEVPGFLTLLYTIRSLSPGDLPWQNKVLAALFTIHYSYRAVAFPFLQPSMAPIHAVVWASALGFQLINGTLLGAWLGRYGPTTQAEWGVQSSTVQFVGGISLFYLGLAANYYHDEELREIRRREQRRQERIAREEGKAVADVGKHYSVPQAGLFKWVLYPHYLCEWVEWCGFWIAAGLGCAPAGMFVVNEVCSMLPRAVRGRRWYEERFGEEKIRGRWAVLPGVV